MSAYPTGYDAFTNPAGSDPLNTSGAKLHSTQHGQVNDAIEAIEAELGLSPSGSEATVAARLTAIEGSIGGGGGGGGLVLIDSDTMSAVSSKSMGAGIFDSTYDTYLIVVSGLTVTGTDVAVTCRLRASGSDESGGSYANVATYDGSAGGVSVNTSTGTSFLVGGQSSGLSQGVTFILDSPALAANTGFRADPSINIPSGRYMQMSVGSLLNTTVYDSFSLLVASGTMSGRIRVYGYAQ
jgi:hypothetical protein